MKIIMYNSGLSLAKNVEFSVSDAGRIRYLILSNEVFINPH